MTSSLSPSASIKVPATRVYEKLPGLDFVADQETRKTWLTQPSLQLTAGEKEPSSAEAKGAPYQPLVRLEPLDLDLHLDALFAAGGQDESVWKYYLGPTPIVFANPAQMRMFYMSFIPSGAQFYVVRDLKTEEVIGSYGLLDVNPYHRHLEIGAIWLNQAYRSRNYNTECLYLLLRHCFETLKTVRVFWKCDSKNERSHKSALAHGAVYEGTLRKHFWMTRGYWRDSVCLSWIDDEWSTAKANLIKRLTTPAKPTQ